MVVGNLAAESGSGSGAGIGGAVGHESGQQNDAAFDSCANAMSFE